LERITEHDIGFAGDRPDSLNKNLTVSNKIFHYMLGGLAVVASNTDGQKEIAASVGSAISIYDAGNPTALAEKLNALLSSQTRLEAAKADSLSFARERYCWEIEKSRLLTLVEKAFSQVIERAGQTNV
jgi:glycosyltransferase involved in cell wall biosynthesis